MKHQRGFTLIELVVVIIVLAVLSAIALPKFINLGVDDSWVDYAGFKATLVDSSHTRFSLDAAPDPLNCSVTYEDTFNRGQALGMELVQTTTGC